MASSASAREVFDLGGRTLIVTGGRRGLGREMSLAFASEASSFTTGSILRVDGGASNGAV